MTIGRANYPAVKKVVRGTTLNVTYAALPVRDSKHHGGYWFRVSSIRGAKATVGRVGIPLASMKAKRWINTKAGGWASIAGDVTHWCNKTHSATFIADTMAPRNVATGLTAYLPSVEAVTPAAVNKGLLSTKGGAWVGCVAFER